MYVTIDNLRTKAGDSGIWGELINTINPICRSHEYHRTRTCHGYTPDRDCRLRTAVRRPEFVQQLGVQFPDERAASGLLVPRFASALAKTRGAELRSRFGR
jgi:hypothetical protein